MVRAKELFTWNPVFMIHKENDCNSDGGSAIEPLNNNDNEEEFDDEYASDVNEVPDTAFGENASSNLLSNDSVKVHQSEDPFGLYDLLNIKKAGETGKSSPSISHSPGFTPEILEDRNDNEAKNTFLRELRFQYRSSQEIPTAEHNDQVSQKGMNNGGSVLGVMEDVIRVGNSGGILCIWEATVFKKENVTISDNFIAIYGSWLPNNAKILFIAVYAPQQSSSKAILWDYISVLLSRWNGETIVMGDFNENKLMEQMTSMCAMVGQFIQKKQEEKQIQEDQAANDRYWKIPAYYDDDDDYNFAITPNEPIDSLSMGDEHLDIVLATKSDEFIKSRSLLNHDSSIIPSSSKIDSLLDEFAGELPLLKSISPGIDETDYHPENEIRLSQRLLYDNSSPHPPEEFVSKNSNVDAETFSPFPIRIEDSDYPMEEIDLTFTPDDPMPPSIEEDYDDSRDILIHEELHDNYSLSLPENESFHFDIPLSSRPPAKPPDGNTGILNIKMMGDVSDLKVPIPEFMITRVSNQEKSPDHLPHRGFENFQPSAECPMKIHGKNIPTLDIPRFHFYPP
nr:RNA-directed DNA polymerase, eukaryota [Tanacetum cinerariifolium]